MVCFKADFLLRTMKYYLIFVYLILNCLPFMSTGSVIISAWIGYEDSPMLRSCPQGVFCPAAAAAAERQAIASFRTEDFVRKRSRLPRDVSPEGCEGFVGRVDSMTATDMGLG